MPPLYNYRIFISHAWKYNEDYRRLVALLDNAPLFEYYNYSAPQEKPLQLSSPQASTFEIKNAISQKIKNAQVVLVLGGMYYEYHSWMKYEVDEAERMNKPIIVIMPWGNKIMPIELSQQANIIVGWSTNSIINAIRSLV